MHRHDNIQRNNALLSLENMIPHPAADCRDAFIKSDTKQGSAFHTAHDMSGIFKNFRNLLKSFKKET